MSYILDALRKSENQRRLGQTPDLSSAPTTPARPGRRWVVWRTGLIVLVAGVVISAAGWWWLANRETAGGLDSPQIAGQTPADSATDPQAPEQGSAPGAQELALAADESTAEQAPEDAAPVQRRRRTVVDRRSPDQQPVTSVSRPAPARPGAVPTPPPVVPAGERERLVTDADQAREIVQAGRNFESSRSAGEAENPESAPRPQAAAEANPATVDAASQSPDWEPERTEFIEVWDLPLAIRRELPELAVSIHVFSTNPEDRFVLINGERRPEGAALGGGARLVEVAREGAIVEFRDYRFLLRP